MTASLMEAAWIADADAVLARRLPWNTLSGSRIVVTGAGGFLGGAIVRALVALAPRNKVELPVRVVAPVRSTERARRRLGSAADDPNLELVEWDLSKIAVPDFGDIDYVIHAASQASPKFYGIDPVGTALPNTVGTAALLEALRRSTRPRGFLFVSSGEVYGVVPEDQITNETTFGPFDPATVRACYGESKRLGETLCVGWHHQYGIPTTIARPFHTYGPGLQEDDGRVFADFTFNVIRGENIAMSSDGSARRIFCYISDAVAGILTVLLKGEPGMAYNVTNPDADLSILELAELLVGLYPELGLSVERLQRSDPNAYLVSPYHRHIPDIGRLAGLGWRPTVPPEIGFRQMIDAYGGAGSLRTEANPSASR